MPPVSMHSTLRLTLVFVFGIVLGAILAAVGIFVALRSGAADSALRAYVAKTRAWPDVSQELAQQGYTQQQQQQAQAALSAPITFAVPPGYATPQYVSSFASLIGDLQGVASTSNQLVPLLMQMNSQSISGNLNGFFDLVFQAKSLLAVQKSLSARLGQDLTALTAANTQTPDATTKSQTEALIASVTTLQGDLVAYNSALDQLLSGAVPTAALVTEVVDSGTKLGTDAKAFNDTFTPLIKRFSSAK